MLIIWGEGLSKKIVASECKAENSPSQILVRGTLYNYSCRNKLVEIGYVHCIREWKSQSVLHISGKIDIKVITRVITRRSQRNIVLSGNKGIQVHDQSHTESRISVLHEAKNFTKKGTMVIYLEIIPSKL